MKLTHAEGSGSILKSRFARGVLPLVAAFLACALAAPEAQALVYTSELSFPSAPEAALADFPVLVRISSTTPSGFSYEDCPDASHLWFTDENGDALPFEVDTWDTNGTSLVWVSVPSLSSSATITMYWASDAANVPDDIPSSSQVWTRAGYNAVWHFSGSAAESVNGLAATANGTPSYNGNASYPGPLGKTLWLDGSSYLSVANDPGWATVGENSTLTISCWARSTRTGTPGCDRMISSMSNWTDTSGYELTIQNDVKVITVGSSGANGTGSQFQTTISTGVNAKWQHFAATYTATTTSLYVDGAAKKSSALNPVVSPVAKLAIGAGANAGSPWAGGLDEVRIRAAASTAEWIAEEYAAMTNANYAVFAEAPLLVSDSLSRTGTATYSLSATAASGGADLAWIAANGASTTTNGWTTAAAGGTVNWTVSGLGADTTYRISVLATNENGTAELPAGIVYAGALSVEKISDAAVKGPAPGSFRISRADAAHDLAVSYSVGGTAEAGQTYVALSGTATIPAGSQFVDVPVVPILDKQMTEDTTVVLTLAAGLYGIQANAGSATLTIEGYKPVRPADYAWSFKATPSDAIRTTLGKNAYADFPVLVRLPVPVSEKLQSADGTDLFFADEDDASLPFEVDTFNPSGETLVWVKVPSLSSATEITVYFGGYANADNDTTAVWTDYVGVWHMSEASGTVADATGHGLGASSAKSTAGSVAYAGGVVGNARQTAVNGTKDYLTIPNYNSHNVGSDFTFSCWYDATARPGYDRLVSRKTSYDAKNGWEVELASSNTKLSARGASGTYISATIPDIVSSGWMRLAFVYSGNTLKAYLNGVQVGSGTIDAATDNGNSLSIGCNANGSEAYFVGYVDEARLRKGAASATEVALEHATMADAAFFDLGAIKAVDKTAQVFETPTAVRNANGSTTVTVVLAENNGDVGVIYDAGSAAITNIIQSNVAPNTYTDTPANLAADTTYRFAAYGKNANDTEVVKKGGVFYNGDLSVAKVSDAAELGLVPGAFRISRADTAYDLTVAYTVGGTAVAGQTYETLSGTATIPAGTNSVDIVVTPLIDTQTTVDTTVTVTLSAGLYGIDAQAGSAELTIVSLVAPAGYNTWISPSNSLASIDCNWSEGHAPTAEENVLFDGSFSTKNCEWDSAASATVASWTQQADYTGTVQIDTTYDSTFPALNVTGNVEILGGNWTHKINEANDGQKYHLKAIVGGDFTLASGCKLDAEMKGYWAQKCPAGSAVSAHAASYDGFGKVYGNVYRPADLGAGSSSAGSATDNKSGGGAVWLEIGGAATLNGEINVRGRQFDGSNTACGSVYVKAKSCAGSGSILANFSAGSYYNGNRGAGGRVAIELTEATTLAFPTANVKINGINAGGSGGGGGTFYVKTADPAKPYGTLYLDDQRGKSYGARWHNPQAITAIPAGETWTFDAIVIRNYGMLAVPAGTTLNLPNGPMSVSATSSRQGGIRYDGGTINWGSAPYEFASNWIFQANAPYTFDGNVVLHDGGTLGCLQFRGNRDLTDFTKCDITVNGDLTVEQGGSITAYAAGPDMEINRDTVSFHGGQSAGASGNKAYDSIFSPRLPGYGTANGDQATSAPGGGLLLLNVSGALVNNGSVGATGGSADNAGASGGSISITAGTLSGTGAFRANSASGSNGSGGGGRIAVRLTNSDFTAGFETNFYALGATVVKDNASSDKSSSAGTVYLQGKSDGEKGGTIFVRNDKNALNVNTYTPIPAGVTKGGVSPDSAADFKKAALVVGDCGRVKFFDELRLRSVQVSSGSVLDLNGKTLVVNTAKVNGVKLAPGTYAAGSTVAIGEGSLGDYLVDTAEGAGGTLRVLGIGTVILVR